MLETLSTPQWSAAAAIVALAYFVRGITGFGSGLIAIPLLALMLPLPLVVPLIGLLDYIASAAHGVKHREAIVWRELLPLLPFTLIGVGLALYLFKTLDAVLLSRVLGGFVLLYALYSLLGREPSGQGSRLWSPLAGGLGGLVGTLFGTGGPFYVIYLHFRGLHKSAFRATIATIFLLDGASRIIGYSLSGLYNRDSLLGVLIGLPLMLLTLWLGGRVHVNLSQQTFRKAIGILLIGAGLALILR
ncbi:MAG: sulfite exporter TauE/SafE family protein [Gammaproteobacteria bacterium SHHR-1]|uniref:sulfite exporter TauE/SafE family protein n=1 Tax=Magnetovirga frankeli TaxID=947516 RepID=UPI001AFC44E8|nr:sulfite exporter TauE/SafE family protein [gamma proteobacterium SS-5]